MVIIILIYLAGAVLHFGLSLYNWQNYPIGKRLSDPLESYKTWKILWIKDFDSQWEDCIKQRNGDVKFVFFLSVFSWLGVVMTLIMSHAYGFQLKLKQLPDKEEFRKKVINE